jgi:predicted metalloendopeptidase
VPLDAWKSYFNWRIIELRLLPDTDTVKERFAFEGTVLRGVPQSEPQWQLALRFTDGALADAVGKRYVKCSAAGNQAARDGHVRQLRRLVQATASSSWTGWAGNQEGSPGQAGRAETEDRLSGQMARLQQHENPAHDLIANVRAARVERQQNLDKLGKPVDRDEWSMTPQTVNASYSPR